MLFTFDAARRFSDSAAFAALCTSLIAFSPQFLFVSSYVNNDVACAALGAAAFWLFAVAAERDRVTRVHYLAAAGLSGIALATKLSALPACLVGCLALFALDGRPLRERGRDAGLAAALGAVLAVPTLWMNWLRFGDALSVSAVLASAHSEEGFSPYGGRFGYLRDVYPYVTFRTYWANFGWLHVFAPGWMYLAFAALCGAGLLGVLLGWRGERRQSASEAAADPRALDAQRRARLLRRFALATLLATFAAHLWINLHAMAMQGRHLFGAAPHFAGLLGLGIGQLAAGAGFGVGWRTAGVLSAGMLGTALYCLAQLLTVYR